MIAHIRGCDHKEHLLKDHLEEVSRYAGIFADKIGLELPGKIIGLLHDYGKASDSFQCYLRSKMGLISPDKDSFVDANRGEIDHSTAGAQLIYKKLCNRGQESKILAQFLALAIVSHHSGLIDCLKPDGFNEFERRIAKDDDLTHLAEARQKLSEIEKKLDEIIAHPIEKKFVERLKQTKELSDSDKTLPFKHGLLARFLLSCLLEADRLNTADFEYPENEMVRNYGNYVHWGILAERLESRYSEYAQKMTKMPQGRARQVNELRVHVGQACLEAARKPKGIYQLTVPTGGGKTEASLRFALHHARAHKMDRVFYIVPYITIIDQNANKVRNILEKDDERGKVVLEHHSNFVPSDDTLICYKLLAENWDAPIVFTTQVQFLEALFGAGTRDARRMHQLANSVIIFDEVQTIPIKITHMFTTALRFLLHDCGASIVLCTATQPPFDNTGNPYRELSIQKENHIIQNELELFQQLKRVEVHDKRKPGGLSNAEIVDLTEHALQKSGNVLLVVNTRPSAVMLYQEIKARQVCAAVYHLSTNMCPAHRLDTLDQIKDKLENKEPVVCVSTQLIEAGVDIDFGAVIRALAGLDSIAQAAGRCNRHGMREDGGNVWVVNLQEENLDRLQDIKIGSEYAQRVLDDYQNTPENFGNDRIGLAAIATYYNYYYQSRRNEMDYQINSNSSVQRNDNLFNLLSVNKLSVEACKAINHNTSPDIFLRQSFHTANREFRVIDSLTCGVIVPYKDGEKIVTKLCGACEPAEQYNLLKRAQRYSVNLYDYQLNKLMKIGAVNEVHENAGIYYLDKQYYSNELGWSDEPVNSMDILLV